MPTKIRVIYENPTDPAAFEAGYAAGQVGLAKKLPGLVIETSKVWPKEDGSPTPAYRLIDLYFPDYDMGERGGHHRRGRRPVPEGGIVGLAPAVAASCSQISKNPGLPPAGPARVRRDSGLRGV